MLKINNLHAAVDGKDILKGLDLEVADGEVHAIMGPNGSGKSTLAQVLAGRDSFTVTRGEVRAIAPTSHTPMQYLLNFHDLARPLFTLS